MKSRYCAVLMSCTSVVAANAATIIAELPESVNLSQTATMAPQTGEQLLNKVKNSGIGVYAGGNNNSLAIGPRTGREPGSTMIISAPSSFVAEAEWRAIPLPWCWADPNRETLFPPSSFPVIRLPPSSPATPWFWRFMTLPERLSRTFPPCKALPLIPRQEPRPFP